MKKILFLMGMSFAVLSTLTAQVTWQQSDEIVQKHISGETRPYAVFANMNLQEAGTTITTASGEVIELDYSYWIYYVRYAELKDNSTGYLIVKESNGNLLEINTNNDIGPDDLLEWYWLIFKTNGYMQTMVWIVGYETCGLTIENGEVRAKGYIAISEDLKDTLVIYNGVPPYDIFIPQEIFSETECQVNASFPEEKQNSYHFLLYYMVSSEEEIRDLGLKKDCDTSTDCLAPTETYNDGIPVIVYAAQRLR